MMADHARSRDEGLDALVDAYVDGTLDDKQALRLHLRAQADPVVEERLRSTRAFFEALESMPRDEPGEEFDAAVLARVPLDRYASAPRRRPPVIVIGDLAPSRLARTVRSMGRLSIAVTAAYLLTLAVAGTQVGSVVASGADRVAATLQSWAAASESVPVLGALVGVLGSIHRAVPASVGGLADEVGLHGATVVLGLVLGVAVLVAATAQRRRRAGSPTVGH